MRRTVLLFGAGLAVGALAMLVASGGDDGGMAPAATPGSADPRLAQERARGPSAVSGASAR